MSGLVQCVGRSVEGWCGAVAPTLTYATSPIRVGHLASFGLRKGAKGRAPS